MPTLAIWVKESDYGRLVRAAEARGSTGSKLVSSLVELVLNDKALQHKLLGTSAD